MSISGLIVEYNPFHNGHKYHLLKSKESSDYTIAVMSGHFLQRGEPALFNKWIRTEMALRAGVDVVIELPVVYSCQSAEFFSYGAISILNKLKIIDSIFFGAETPNTSVLYEIANILAFEPEMYKKYLREHLKDGKSFPSARSLALKNYFQNSKKNLSQDLHNLLHKPNNILGIEYIKCILRLNSNITPKIIQRIGSGYHDQELKSVFASATAIRNTLLTNNVSTNNLKKYLPPSSISLINDSMNFYHPGNLEYISKSIFSILLRMNSNDLKRYSGIKEGLNDRFYNLIKTNSIEEYIKLINTKRYTQTRIQRILVHILLNLTEDDLIEFNVNGGPQYIRILGFTKRGQEILPLIKQNCDLPIITNLSKSYKRLNHLQKKMINYDILATNIYHTHFSKSPTYKHNMDFLHSPLIL